MNRLDELKLLLMKKQAVTPEQAIAAAALIAVPTMGGLGAYAIHSQHKHNVNMERLANAFERLAKNTRYTARKRREYK